MDRLELMKKITIKNEKKIVMLVIDGLGGIPHPDTNLTELQTAKLNNINKLANISRCGLTIPVAYGITPGSGPSHLSLFGYDPLKYEIGRGILEALGIGLEITENDIACRANYAKLDYSKNIIIDRRAGRIPTTKNIELCKLLQENIKKIDDTEIIIKPGKGHRFVIVFRGKNLSEKITENDPQKDNFAPKPILPITKDTETERTAKLINIFIEKVKQLIKGEPDANYVLLRGFSKYPDIPSMQDIYKLNPAAIATYTMYKGLAQLVGMKILDTGETLADEINTLTKEYKNYDFFYVHVKETDAYGEDGNFEGKVKKLEEVDKYIPDILALNPDVFIITGDHSTPAVLKGHSWHNVPFLLYSPKYKVSGINSFNEIECLKGDYGIFHASDIITLALANTFKLNKYGA